MKELFRTAPGEAPELRVEQGRSPDTGFPSTETLQQTQHVSLRGARIRDVAIPDFNASMNGIASLQCELEFAMTRITGLVCCSISALGNKFLTNLNFKEQYTSL